MNGDCQCHSGFHGSHCTQNYCQPHPCLNNGTCHGLMDGYKCNCLAGFEGRICQHLCNATHFGQNCANRFTGYFCVSVCVENCRYFMLSAGVTAVIEVFVIELMEVANVTLVIEEGTVKLVKLVKDRQTCR